MMLNSWRTRLVAPRCRCSFASAVTTPSASSSSSTATAASMTSTRARARSASSSTKSATATPGAADATVPLWRQFAVVSVHSNALAQMHVREFERRFEIFKAAYERPIAEQHARFERERLAAIRERVQQAKAERLKLKNLKESGSDTLPPTSVLQNAPYANMFLSTKAGAALVPPPRVKGKKRSHTPNIDRRLAMIDEYLDRHREELQRMAGKAPAAMLEALFAEQEGDENSDAASESTGVTMETYAELERVEDVTDLTAEQLAALEEDPNAVFEHNNAMVELLLPPTDPAALEQESRELEENLEDVDENAVDEADLAVVEFVADQINKENDGQLGYMVDEAMAEGEEDEAGEDDDDEYNSSNALDDEDDDVDDIGDVDEDEPA